MGAGAMGFMTPPRRVGDFHGVDRDVVDRLEAAGIVHADELLVAGHLPDDRAGLADTTGLPVRTIRELVGLADLSRIEGMEPPLAHLLYAAGVHSVEALADADAAALGARMAEVNAEQHIVPGASVAWTDVAAELHALLREHPLPEMVVDTQPTVDEPDGSEVTHRDAG